MWSTYKRRDLIKELYFNTVLGLKLFFVKFGIIILILIAKFDKIKNKNIK